MSAPAIRRLNMQFRGKDCITDVLSFEYEKPTGNRSTQIPEEPHLGDIAIALVPAQKNARQIGHSVDHEICFLIVHGTLHICGYDHVRKQDEEVMIRLQRRLMLKLKRAKLLPRAGQLIRKVRPVELLI